MVSSTTRIAFVAYAACLVLACYWWSSFSSSSLNGLTVDSDSAAATRRGMIRRALHNEYNNDYDEDDDDKDDDDDDHVVWQNHRDLVVLDRGTYIYVRNLCDETMNVQVAYVQHFGDKSLVSNDYVIPPGQRRFVIRRLRRAKFFVRGESENWQWVGGSSKLCNDDNITCAKRVRVPPNVTAFTHNVTCIDEGGDKARNGFRKTPSPTPVPTVKQTPFTALTSAPSAAPVAQSILPSTVLVSGEPSLAPSSQAPTTGDTQSPTVIVGGTFVPDTNFPSGAPSAVADEDDDDTDAPTATNVPSAGTTVGPTPEDTTLAPTVVETTVAPSPRDTSLAPTVFVEEETLVPTALDTDTLAPTALDTDTLAPTALDTDEPTPDDSTLTPTAEVTTAMPSMLQTLDPTQEQTESLAPSEESLQPTIVTGFSPNSILSINAGATETVTFEEGGGTWLPDTPYLAPNNLGGTNNFATVPVEDTDADFLYQTERFGDGLTYQLPVPVNNANYRVILHFAEVFSRAQSVGNRVFNVIVENNQEVFEGVDIFSLVGANTPLILHTRVFVADNFLTVQLVKADASSRNPKISGLELIPLPLDDEEEEEEEDDETGVPTVAPSVEDTLVPTIDLGEEEDDTLTPTISIMPTLDTLNPTIELDDDDDDDERSAVPSEMESLPPSLEPTDTAAPSPLENEQQDATPQSLVDIADDMSVSAQQQKIPIPHMLDMILQLVRQAAAEEEEEDDDKGDE